jgi:cell division protein FtsN
MKLLSRLNLSREGNGSRKEPSDINMSSVVSVGVVLVVGMCFAFILGILVGRGYRPENAVPQLANVMPTTEPAHVEEPQGGEPKALKPEDLTFMEGLQDKGKDGEVVADSTQKGSADPKKSGSSTLKSRDLTDARSTAVAPPIPPAPQAGPAPAKAAPPDRPTVPPPATPPAPAKAAVEPKTPFAKPAGARYHATYQVASFPGREQAESMVKRLADKGLTASVHEGKSKDRTVFRVNISLRGTEVEITEGLRRAGEKGPILLDKKPL